MRGGMRRWVDDALPLHAPDPPGPSSPPRRSEKLMLTLSWRAAAYDLTIGVFSIAVCASLLQFFFEECTGKGGLNSEACGFQFASATSFIIPFALFFVTGLIGSPAINRTLEEHKRLRIQADEIGSREFEKELALRRSREKTALFGGVLVIAIIVWGLTQVPSGDDYYQDDDSVFNDNPYINDDNSGRDDNTGDDGFHHTSRPTPFPTNTGDDGFHPFRDDGGDDVPSYYYFDRS